MPGASTTRFPGCVECNPNGQGALGTGGEVVCLKAHDAITVGQAVYINDEDEVDAGAAANAALGIGIVVGGVKTGYRVYPEAKIGEAASSAGGQMVLVQVSGIAPCISDGAYALGDKLTFGVAAGKVDTAGGIDYLGKALNAATGADQTKRVLLNGG